MAWNNFRSNCSIRFSQNSKNQQASNKLTRLRKRKTSSHDNSAFPQVFKLGLTFEPKLFQKPCAWWKVKTNVSWKRHAYDFYHILKIYVKKQRKEGNDLAGKKKKNVGLTKVNYFPKLFFCYKLYINDLKRL